MNFTIYQLKTGKPITTGSCSNIDFEKQVVPVDCGIIPLFVELNSQFVVSEKVENLPPKPDGFYSFDYTNKIWKFNEEESKKYIKKQRQMLLLSSDWTQLPNNPLTSEQQAAWATYRQQLRDITSQSGYPTNVVWPIQPE